MRGLLRIACTTLLLLASLFAARQASAALLFQPTPDATAYTNAPPGTRLLPPVVIPTPPASNPRRPPVLKGNMRHYPQCFCPHPRMGRRLTRTGIGW